MGQREGGAMNHKLPQAFPSFAFYLWAGGIGDLHCANDKDLPISKLQRIGHRVRGEVVAFLFGWWWWK